MHNQNVADDQPPVDIEFNPPAAAQLITLKDNHELIE